MKLGLHPRTYAQRIYCVNEGYTAIAMSVYQQIIYFSQIQIQLWKPALLGKRDRID